MSRKLDAHLHPSDALYVGTHIHHTHCHP
uniref:Uncharacterized protein n=1 Tax=Arundo donax TaxID=35708 RepID=A0A0A8YZH5_ARUDO